MRPACCLPLVVAALAGLGVRAGAEERRFARSELHMGVEFEVVLYAEDEARASAALTKAMARIAALDKALSDYDLESELSRLSATSHVTSPTPPAEFPAVSVSDELLTVLATGQEISRASGGAFDVTVGPLTRLWRRARRQRELPDAELLKTAQASVGYKFLQLDAASKTARLQRPNMRLDLGGIAKGFAADEAVKAVVGCGLPRVLVRGSGDIACWDPPPGQAGWTIGVAPLDPDDPPQEFISLRRLAVSTSGDARQHLVVDGKRYSHILDPRTGQPVSGRSSVTVIATSGIIADALDTAASVLGPEQSLALLKQYPGSELLMTVEDAAGLRHRTQSPEFQKYETTKPTP
ncbi:MAG TPA: FAD:protein FMN transferase [Pirellulaceae bacterium]|nr:FAD:protein FMN transferase [Pirellulaceae bacterium]